MCTVVHMKLDHFLTQFEETIRNSQNKRSIYSFFLCLRVEEEGWWTAVARATNQEAKVVGWPHPL